MSYYIRGQNDNDKSNLHINVIVYCTIWIASIALQFLYRSNGGGGGGTHEFFAPYFIFLNTPIMYFTFKIKSNISVNCGYKLTPHQIIHFHRLSAMRTVYVMRVVCGIFCFPLNIFISISLRFSLLFCRLLLCVVYARTWKGICQMVNDPKYRIGCKWHICVYGILCVMCAFLFVEWEINCYRNQGQPHSYK